MSIYKPSLYRLNYWNLALLNVLGVEDIVDLLDTPLKEELTIDEDDFSTLIPPNPYASNLRLNTSWVNFLIYDLWTPAPL